MILVALQDNFPHAHVLLQVCIWSINDSVMEYEKSRGKFMNKLITYQGINFEEFYSKRLFSACFQLKINFIWIPVEKVLLLQLTWIQSIEYKTLHKAITKAHKTIHTERFHHFMIKWHFIALGLLPVLNCFNGFKLEQKITLDVMWKCTVL